MVAEARSRRVDPPPGAERSGVTTASPDLAEAYELHFRYVWRCLRSLGVFDAQLEDALQDVFMVVQQKLSGFDGRAELRTWLYAIALRVARKYRERRRREHAPLDATRDDPPDLVLAVTGEGTALQNERLELARAALDTLSDEQREVFVLARVEQMSAPEIAEITSTPLNTVYSRLRAARLAFEAEVARLQSSARNSP